MLWTLKAASDMDQWKQLSQIIPGIIYGKIRHDLTSFGQVSLDQYQNPHQSIHKIQVIINETMRLMEGKRRGDKVRK